MNFPLSCYDTNNHNAKRFMQWWAFKRVPQYLHLLVFRPFSSPHPYWILLCYQKDTKEMIVCDFWSLVIKGIAGSALLFLGSLALAEASCMWWRHSSCPIEGSCREKLRPPVNGRHGPASSMKRPVDASGPDPVKPTSWLWHHGDPGTEAP